jgi:5-methylcytosine-specific restriction endonuclease McrA
MRPCPYPHCGRLISQGAYCGQHALLHDARRGNAITRGYDRRWASSSRRWLRKYPYCGTRVDGVLSSEHSQCWRAGQLVRAEVTDHIVAIRDGGSRESPSNHQSLCRSCNAKKSNL